MEYQTSEIDIIVAQTKVIFKKLDF
jgi:hypothetical protein